jgi:predicted MPP superfamily phosphohydrolase
LWLAGNELPWYSGAEKLEPVESVRGSGNDFFVVLSHSPDQWRWAKNMGFDLMLAGHTHGGQVCLPVIGPIIAPSRFGVRYAGGVFDLGGLAMQVSRGISGAEPLRWNCPPELCQLTLRCGGSSRKSSV